MNPPVIPPAEWSGRRPVPPGICAEPQRRLRGELGRERSWSAAEIWGELARGNGYAASSGMNVTSPAAVSPGSRTISPVSRRPRSARLNPSMQLVAGSTQKKSRPAGV